MSAFSSRKVLVAVAAVAATALTFSVALPAQAASEDKTLRVAGIIPLTGGLSFLSPPEVAAIHLAIDEINAAGGVLGNKVQLTIADSGDGDTLQIADQSATKAIAGKADVVIGAASSGVTRSIINKITGAQIAEISMSNTAPDLSTWKDGGYYFRTAPSDLLQGKIIANQILQDGSKNVAIIYQDSSYGKGLADVASGVLTKGKATVTPYAFPENETNFASIVDKALAAKPDAILLVSYDEAKKAIPALKAKAFDAKNLYLVDGNLADYSKESFAAYLNGAKGSLPGKATDKSFAAKLKAKYKAVTKKDLTELAYGAETYDAVILAALAAQASGKATGAGIKSQLTNVSLAGSGKVKVTSFAAGLKALKAGKKINYDGQSGPVEFDKNGDPTGAFIGIYRYGTAGTYAENLVKVVAGNTVK
jgi:branched-chain amino acid transport system substrate-binding protein